MTFVILIAVEGVLIWLAASRRSRAARLAVFLVPLVFALSLRVYQALGTRGVLDWDETYYLSTAVTAAAGHGLYPYIFGYAPMPILGGFGYAGYVNALAVAVAGPSIIALRVLSLAAAIAGLAGLWRLVRIWYGPDAAWMSVSLTAASSLFLLSNTARMDTWTFAWTTWALVVFAFAWQRWDMRAPHVIAGLVFALGLQVHPDVIVTALACGAVYTGAWLLDIREARQFVAPRQPLFYLAGWCLGFLVFLAANVLPDPDAFYKTTMLVRVDATAWYSQGTPSVLGSFLDPRILLAKERARYALLAGVVPWFEVALAAAAIVAACVRRTAADRLVLALSAAVIVVTAFMLNNAAPVYFIHVAPALFVPIGALFAHGVSHGAQARRAMPPARLIAFAVCAAALCAINDARLLRGTSDPLTEDVGARIAAGSVRAVADKRCKVAGDGGLYVRYFADYPYFISTRPTELRYARIFYGVDSDAAYWAIKQPDIVFGPLSVALRDYVSANGFSERASGVWGRRDGCAGGP